MKRIASAIILLLLPLSAHASAKAGYAWNHLQDGLAYARVYHNRGTDESPRLTTIHAFRIDPKKLRVDVITALESKRLGESVKSMAQRHDALVAANGGFFTPAHKSIGLLVKSGKRINAIHNTSWWSVFGIRRGKASILPPWQAKHVKNYQMAIQAGPRLVVNGRIPKLKNDAPNARTAVGITKRGDVILIATSGAGITMRDLAEKMRTNRFKGGLGCPDAMALDGGSSTQLYAKVGNLKVSLSSFSPIPNGIAVLPK